MRGVCERLDVHWRPRLRNNATSTAWLGLTVLILHRAGQHRALGLLRIVMTANPAADLAMAATAGPPHRALAHISDIVATATIGCRLLRRTRPSPS